ncbi:sensor domain-containing diguanylate cyclase [Bradyrhizobium sp. WD16]|uniref:sensor domain-containing diguanylate cyclase n=1 Tax=Bradyrhizobium sp. WD16 TaxID=1521768 RepID=UPI0020A4CBE9|nr:sensor domain-containing diguanylate cyclase [Bradyrhizobium sp. WD16]
MPASMDSTSRQSTEQDVQFEQIRILFGFPAVILANLASAPVTATFFRPIFPSWALLTWLSLVAIVVAARLLLWRRFTRSVTAIDSARRWAYGFTLGSFATGCLWGLLATVVLRTDAPVYHVFASFVVGGMTAGAVLRNSAFLPAFYGFAAPTLLPLVVTLFVRNAPLSNVMAIMLCVLAVVLLILGYDYNQFIMRYIRLQLDQTKTNADLAHTAAELQLMIADHEQAAAALMVSNQRLAAIGESAQDAFVIAGPNGSITYWNPAAERMFGYEAAEIIGRDVHTVLAPQRYHAKALDGQKRFASTGTGEVVGKTMALSALRKDGTEFPADISISAMRLGDAWHSLGVVRDTTDRRRAEAELRERETELREAQALARFGSWSWSRDEDIFKWSNELYRMFGLDPDVPLPTIAEFANILSPEGFKRQDDAFVLCKKTGAPFEIDLEASRADGTTMWITVRGRADHDASGRVSRIYGTVQDITARKLAEQSIAKLHQQMTANVAVLKQHEQDMTTIAKLSDILQSCRTTGEAYPIIAATANRLFRDTSGALAIVIEDTNELEAVTQWGTDQAILAHFTFDDCWALRTGQRYEVREAGSTVCSHFKSPPCGPYVCLPLTVRGDTTGLLHVNLPAGQSFDEDMFVRMASFGDVAKLSLSNSRLRETLSEQAIRDQLTTLFNRHYLVETLPREIRRAERDNSSLCIAMLDIDYFKTFNDTHGHDAGDALLRELGTYLRASLRAGDIACRYGGEEFLLVLPECGIDDARRRLQQICLDISRKTVVFHSQDLPRVTISAGLAELSEDLSSPDMLIAAADDALYAAKRNGRNRVETYAADMQNAIAPVPPGNVGTTH